MNQLANQTKYGWIKAREFYNRSIKSGLQNNDIEMYSTRNEGKSVVAERFVRILKDKMYKYMTSISKNMYIDKVGHIVNKYNNTYHSTIKITHVDIKPSTYIGFNKKIIRKIPNLKLVTMSGYRNIKTSLEKVTLQVAQKKCL